MNPRYFPESLEWRMGPLVWLRLRGGRLKILYNLEKWKISVFPYSITRPNCSKSEKIILQLQKWREFVFLKNFSCNMKSPLSMKERNKTGIFRFFALFSKIWKIGNEYRAKKIRECFFSFIESASFSLTTILYGNIHKRISEYNIFYYIYWLF